MLENIKIGQYIDGNSFIHRLDPRTKLFCNLCLAIILLSTNNIYTYFFIGIMLCGIAYITKISPKIYINSLKPIFYLALFTALLNIFLIKGAGKPVFHFWYITIFAEGIAQAIKSTNIFILLLFSSSIVIFTSSQSKIIYAIEMLLSPLKFIGFPVAQFALILSITLRFLPTLLKETEKIIKAQSARGIDFESGSIIRRIKNIIPILIPLFINIFKRADDLSMAMESRCYNTIIHKTQLNQLKFISYDYIISISALIITILLFILT